MTFKFGFVVFMLDPNCSPLYPLPWGLSGGARAEDSGILPAGEIGLRAQKPSLFGELQTLNLLAVLMGISEIKTPYLVALSYQIKGFRLGPSFSQSLTGSCVRTLEAVGGFRGPTVRAIQRTPHETRIQVFGPGRTGVG